MEGLYRRFRSLDREHKGYISGEAFLAIPELSINPIASRLVSAPRLVGPGWYVCPIIWH